MVFLTSQSQNSNFQIQMCQRKRSHIPKGISISGAKMVKFN